MQIWLNMYILHYHLKDNRVSEGGNLIRYCSSDIKWFDIPEVIQGNPRRAVGFPAKRETEQKEKS